MFGQEKYSKEIFEKVEKELEKDKQSLAFLEDPNFEKNHLRAVRAAGLSALIPEGRHREVREQIIEAREKLSKMKMAGHKEANGLNEEYDNLCAKTARALEAQHTFEVEKLGMHKDGNEAETIV